jgi:hypothetical protein
LLNASFGSAPRKLSTTNFELELALIMCIKVQRPGRTDPILYPSRCRVPH